MNVPPPGRPKAGPSISGSGKAAELPSPPFTERGPGSKQYILSGDVGGTKTLLGLAREGRLIVDRRYANADFQDFSSVLARFFADTHTDPAALGQSCFAVAGPIADDGAAARLTNLPWEIVAGELARDFGMPPPRLVNDFAAAAIGAVSAGSDTLVCLQAGEPLAASPRLVVGAGTGLGMAIVVPEGKRWRCIPGEGGHVAFAPADEQQAALWRHLRQRHGRVTWERVVSGPGLAAIHEFLGGPQLTPEQIASAALTDSACREARALEIFLAAYGAFAGDMALACLARGGVYLAGGIAGRLLDLLPGSGFLSAFNAKAEHAAIAARMPVSVTTDPLLGLRGALMQAAD
ncbi:MAG: glucokinase [Rhodocyclales bacterium]|nr:glucokinase [Rhodocyclales bacterium]